MKIPDRPQMGHDEIRQILGIAGVRKGVALLGVRGFFIDIMTADENDRKIYDDAIFLVSNLTHLSFNANCDPGEFRKGIANLMPGLWSYKIGIHGLSKPKEKQYKALVQADKVKISRDGGGDEFGFFGINIHRGSVNSVSSEGCQTIHPSQWTEFMDAVSKEMAIFKQTTIPYLLIENSIS